MQYYFIGDGVRPGGVDLWGNESIGKIRLQGEELTLFPPVEYDRLDINYPPELSVALQASSSVRPCRADCLLVQVLPHQLHLISAVN